VGANGCSGDKDWRVKELGAKTERDRNRGALREGGGGERERGCREGGAKGHGRMMDVRRGCARERERERERGREG